jgi:ribosomal protein L37AE/L43A
MNYKKTKKIKKVKKAIKRDPYNKRKHVLKRKVKKEKKEKPSTELILGKDGLPKRPRGRPRKSILDDNSHALNDTSKKRGRPKKVYPTEYKKEEPVIPMKPMKILKFAGYCPICQLTLTTQDVDNGIFTCYKCNKSGKVEDLLVSIPKRETAKSKKEYLQTVNSTVYEDIDSYHKPIKEEVEEEEKPIEKIETTEIPETTEATKSIEPIVDDTDDTDEIEENTENIDPIDPADIVELSEDQEGHVKTDEELTIEKELKNLLDKDDE